MSATADTIEHTIEMQPGVVAELPLECVSLDLDQPRKDIDGGYIAELAADIKLRGVKQPITVRAHPEAPGRFLVKYGECRLRASVAAGKATVPALLDTEDGAADGLSRLLDQVKENHIRRDLNPMEWAGVLRRLRDDHKIKSMANIEQTLRDHGITNMGRAYISNIMRLAELPEWAQSLIRAGELTAAHGKYLLSAVRSEPVLQAIEKELTDEDADIPSVRVLQDMILDAYQGNHIRLDAFWSGPLFDYKSECASIGCQKMRKISTEHNSGTFCLDADCHEQKNTAARKAQKAASEQAAQSGDAYQGPPTAEPPIVAEDGTVDLDAQELDVDVLSLERAPFDTQACKSCEHCHTAVEPSWERDDDGNAQRFQYLACFEGGECYRAKMRAKQQECARLGEATDKITHWLRDTLAERIAGDVDTQLAVIGHVATAPFRIDFDAIEEAARNAGAAGISGLNRLLADGLMAHSDTLAANLVGCLEIESLAPLARHAQIEIEDCRLGRGYFTDMCLIHNRDLVDYLIGTEHYTDDDRGRLAAESDDELIERAIKAAGTPEITDEIRQAWDQVMADRSEDQ